MVRMTAAAYALSCTSACGALSWKNTLRGSVAVGSSGDVGMSSENPAVNITPAASPMLRPTASSVAVAMAGAICLTTTTMVSRRVAPRLNDDSMRSRGMFFATSSMLRIRIGTTSSVSTIMPPSNDALSPSHIIMVKANAP